MKAYTLSQFSKKKFKPVDWHKSIMDRLRAEMDGYDISEETWERHVSVWITEALNEFSLDLRKKIVRDLKKGKKKTIKAKLE